MFGLEDQKKKKPAPEYVFDLEKELKDLAKQKQIKQKVEGQLQKIKEHLRTGGENQEDFEGFGLLLHGYNSLLKVMSRLTTKTK